MDNDNLDRDDLLLSQSESNSSALASQPSQARLQSRRRFLSRTAGIVAGSMAVAGTGALLTTSAHASALTVPSGLPSRKLRLVNAHTWEKLDVTYWADGQYIDVSLQQIFHLMRDHRADESIVMDRQLLDDLHRLYALLDTKERIHILSGYRTPETNAKLRKRSNGVAKYSLHMEGRAVDISVPGRHAKDIRTAARSMKAGGVGYYASSGFVHIDTGKVRHWDRG